MDKNKHKKKQKTLTHSLTYHTFVDNNASVTREEASHAYRTSLVKFEKQQAHTLTATNGFFFFAFLDGVGCRKMRHSCVRPQALRRTRVLVKRAVNTTDHTHSGVLLSHSHSLLFVFLSHSLRLLTTMISSIMSPPQPSSVRKAVRVVRLHDQ